MSAMEKALAIAEELTNDPLRARIRSLLTDCSTPGPVLQLEGKVVVCGEVIAVNEDILDIDVFPFVPFAGFDAQREDGPPFRITMPGLAARSIQLSAGVRVVCAGGTTSRNESGVVFAAGATICFRPELEQCMPWNFLHLFAGSFSGWTHATAALDRIEQDFTVGQEISLDHDEEVMKIWSLRTHAKVHRCPIDFATPWPHSQQVGILGTVDDWTVLNICRMQSNVCVTLSPPCQSWSRAGRKAGLNDANGLAFVEAIELLTVVQPILIVGECSDEIAAHRHFHILEMLFAVCGFKKTWMQVTPLHELTDHCRTRWLSTWARVDANPNFVGFSFALKSIPKTPWSDPCYQFRIPSIWGSQMVLSESECAIYGDPALYPGKKSFEGKPKPIQVLWARVPPTSHPLPTLCAAYTSQHTLAPQHVQSRGLYTFLNHTSAGFEFFDPARFCGLFGAINDCSFPSKLHLAFRGVGNAIASPHAILAVAISLHSIGHVQVDPLQAVRQAWAMRLTSQNAVLFASGDFVHLVRKSQLLHWISPRPVISLPQGQSGICFSGTLADVKFECMVPDTVTCLEAICLAFEGPHDLLAQVSFRTIDEKPHSGTPMRALTHAPEGWEIAVAGIPIGKCHVVFRTEVIEESNALPVPSALRQLFQIDNALDFDRALATPWVRDILIQAASIVDDHAGNASVIFLHGEYSCDVQVFGPYAQIMLLIRQVQQAHPECRLARACSFGGVTTLFVICADKCCEAHQVQVILHCPDTSECRLASVPSEIMSDAEFQFQHTKYTVSTINAAVCLETSAQCLKDDLLVLQPHVIAAGGHHASPGPRPTLAAGAPFNDRAEFMCNTLGWAATDEIAAATQWIQWSQGRVRFTQPLMWDPNASDFDDVREEINIANNCATILPILMGNHWIAVEVLRQEDVTRLTFLQVPPEQQAALTFIVARILDIAPHRLEVLTDQPQAPQHLCGWMLLYRWITRLDLQHQLPDISTQFPLPQHYADIIEMCLHCSVEDWRSAHMDQDVAVVALRLRRNFLWHIARDEHQGQPSQQIQLVTAFPVPHQVVLTVTPDDPNPQNRAEAAIRARFEHFHRFQGWAGSDEMDFALDFLRPHHPATLFCAPAIWQPAQAMLHYLNDIIPDLRAHRHIVWIVATGNHWVQIELYALTDHTAVYFTVPPADRQRLHPLLMCAIAAAETDLNELTVDYVDQDAPPDMCGFHLLSQLFHRLMLQVGPLGDAQLRAIGISRFFEEIDDTRNEAGLVWRQSGACDELVEFATHVRSWFIIRVIENRFPVHYIAAGAGDAEMLPSDNAPKIKPGETAGKGSGSTTPSAPDPWLANDPWSKRPPRPQQSKWEDLTLQAPLPFVNQTGHALGQTHRLQLGPSKGGVVLTTKAHLQEISKLGITSELVALIPATDSMELSHLASKLEGPYEVSLFDPTAKIAYKRLVHMVVFAGKIRFQLPEAKYKMTTPAIAELVLELDSRLVSKSDFDKVKESPIMMFKTMLHEVMPSMQATVTLYGYRVSHHPGASKQEAQLQCVLKAPFVARKQLLEASGSTSLLIRDYLEKGKEAGDTTVLPRFWPISTQELQKVRITIQGTPGVAGIVVARRGLAVRVWCDQVKAARESLLAGDSRLVPENMHIVPKLSIELSGWPAATDAAHVVASTIAAIGLPVIPMRTYRAAGVHTWVVTAQEHPKTNRFTLEINKDVVEILGQEIGQNVPVRSVAKGKSKGKTKSSPKQEEAVHSWPLKAPPSGSRPDDARLDRLDPIAAMAAASTSSCNCRWCQAPCHVQPL